MSKGYGNVNPKFRNKYFKHLQERKGAGPHDPKNAKQQALEKLERMESMQAHHEPPPEEIFDVNEQVRVIAGVHKGECGRIVIRRQDNGDLSYGIVFPWDVSMLPHYVSGNQIERDND